MRTIAATSALHDLEVVAFVDRLGYAWCRDCAADRMLVDATSATPSAFEIEDRCEGCSVVLRSVGCAHWRSPTIDVSPHPTLEHTDLVTKRCEKCGDERVLHSGRYRGSRKSYGSDPFAWMTQGR